MGTSAVVPRGLRSLFVPPLARRPLEPLPLRMRRSLPAAAQFCWEKWQVEKERVKLSDYCKKQW